MERPDRSSRPVRSDREAKRATWLGLIAILLWSATVALGRSMVESLGPLRAGAAVYLTAGLLLVGHLLVTERSLARLRTLSRPYLFGCGALFVLYTIALFLALGRAADRTQTLEVGLVNYLWPALTILFSLVILGRKANGWLIPGTLLALGGVFLVLTQGAAISWRSFAHHALSNPTAYGLALICALSWALYSNLVRRWARPGDGGGVPLFVLITGVALFLLSLVNPEEGTWSLRTGAEVGFLALATGLAYVFWDIAMREGDAVLVVACSYLTPFFSTVVSCLYLRVLPAAGLWIGCLLIIAGSFLSRRSILPQVEDL